MLTCVIQQSRSSLMAFLWFRPFPCNMPEDHWPDIHSTTRGSWLLYNLPRWYPSPCLLITSTAGSNVKVWTLFFFFSKDYFPMPHEIYKDIQWMTGVASIIPSSCSIFSFLLFHGSFDIIQALNSSAWWNILLR